MYPDNIFFNKIKGLVQIGDTNDKNYELSNFARNSNRSTFQTVFQSLKTVLSNPIKLFPWWCFCFKWHHFQMVWNWHRNFSFDHGDEKKSLFSILPEIHPKASRRRILRSELTFNRKRFQRFSRNLPTTLFQTFTIRGHLPTSYRLPSKLFFLLLRKKRSSTGAFTRDEDHVQQYPVAVEKSVEEWQLAGLPRVVRMGLSAGSFYLRIYHWVRS